MKLTDTIADLIFGVIDLPANLRRDYWSWHVVSWEWPRGHFSTRPGEEKFEIGGGWGRWRGLKQARKIARARIDDGARNVQVRAL